MSRCTAQAQQNRVIIATAVAVGTTTLCDFKRQVLFYNSVARCGSITGRSYLGTYLGIALFSRATIDHWDLQQR